MIDGAGGLVLRYWKGTQGRKQSERWVETVLAKIRAGDLEVSEDSAAHAFAWGRTPEGELLDLLHQSSLCWGVDHDRIDGGCFRLFSE
jgi:fatty-acid peroxygenase